MSPAELGPDGESMSERAGRLVLVATPIGNLEDNCDMHPVACHGIIRRTGGLFAEGAAT